MNRAYWQNHAIGQLNLLKVATELPPVPGRPAFHRRPDVNSIGFAHPDWIRNGEKSVIFALLAVNLLVHQVTQCSNYCEEAKGN